MSMTLRRVWFAVLALPLLFTISPVFAEGETVRLYFFQQEGCPMCERMKPFLAEVAAAEPRLEIVEEEVGRTIAGLRSLKQAADKFGIESPNVPAVFLGTHAWIGYSGAITAEILKTVESCLESGCIDAMNDPLPGERTAGETVVETRVFGKIDLGALPLGISTLLIALLDGVNPCSLWVLTFLLGMVMHTGSRRKILVVGLVFLVTTAAIYGLFILGIVQVLSILSIAVWIRYAVALLAFAMGAVNVKDFFAFKKGISLTISDRNRRRISTRVRGLISSDRSTLSLAASTVFLAAGVAIVELPCTAGFPVIWSNLVSSAGTAVPMFAILLSLYLLVYLADELVIVGAAVLSFRRITMDEARGRYLKLIGGVVMIALSSVMVISPALMESVVSVALLFAASIGLSLLLILIDRRILRSAEKIKEQGELG